MTKNGKLDITGLSQSIRDGRDLIVHFRHNVTDEDRADLLAAVNAALSPPEGTP